MSFNFRITPENDAALEALVAAKGGSKNKYINQALAEFLVHESKLKTLITGLARLKTQVAQNERVILSHYQTFELFVEKFFILSPIYPQEELRRRVDAGKRNMAAFIEEALRANRNSGMPVLLERMDQEVDQILEEEDRG